MFCGSEKVGKIQRFVGWTDENVTHTKMQEQTGLNCANEQRETESNEKTCSKSSVVVALRLLPTENWIWKELFDFWTKSQAKSAVKVVANGVYTAKVKTKNHLRRRERERLALRTADVWVWVCVYNSTVYNAKGTTWSGSPLWKQARQEVRQHWFIDSYIAAYIQVLYMVDRVHLTGLTMNQGCRQLSKVIL